MARENKKFNGVLVDEKDQPIEGSNFVGWRSRSIAITNIIVMNNPNEPDNLYFLVEKRGPGCPDNNGKLVFPCGYVGWDETLREAAVRETWEETGLKINDPKELIFAGINDSPNANLQNITVRFITKLDLDYVTDLIDSGKINIDTKSRGGENDECDFIKILSYKYIKTHRNLFAFDHDSLADLVVNRYEDLSKSFYVDSLGSNKKEKKGLLSRILNVIFDV